jgi:hypothetical protein
MWGAGRLAMWKNLRKTPGNDLQMMGKLHI